MPRVLQPWQLFVTILAGWINDHQQAAIEYLREENRVLKEQLGGKRLRLTDDQRRRLAAKGKTLGRWHRKLIARKWDYSDIECRERLGGTLRYYYRAAA